MEATGGPRPYQPAFWARAVVRTYQRVLSPVLGGNCRFVPSCSEYAHEALGKHGLLRGTWMSLRRLGRCNPWGGAGYDPVEGGR